MDKNYLNKLKDEFGFESINQWDKYLDDYDLDFGCKWKFVDELVNKIKNLGKRSEPHHPMLGTERLYNAYDIELLFDDLPANHVLYKDG